MWYFDPASFREDVRTQVSLNFATATSVIIQPEPEHSPEYYVIVAYYPGNHTDSFVPPVNTYEEAADFLIALFSAFQDGHVVVTPESVAEYLDKVVTR